MMVMRKKTGWEHLQDQPEVFFESVLQLQLEPHHRAMIRAIGDGRRQRLGLVWDPNDQPTADEATIAVGLALWGAACRHRPTVMWSGRRSMASAWIDHAVVILTAARPDFRTDFKIARENEYAPWGIVLPNGAWALRYDGALRTDPLNTVHGFGNCADVLMGDFEWMEREGIEDALAYADEHEAFVTTVVGVNGRS